MQLSMKNSVNDFKKKHMLNRCNISSKINQNYNQMKTYIIALAALFVYSCSKMNDLHDGYLEEGEIIYAAKVDSVGIKSGNERIQLDLVIASQRVEKVRVYWDEYTDSSDVLINNQVGVFSHILEAMEEKSYVFKCISFDKFGNASLPFEVTGRVYAGNYQKQLVNRRLNMNLVDTETANNVLRLAWTILNTLDQGLVVKYTNSAGNLVELQVPADEDTTYIEDWGVGTAFSYSTAYKPVENALDTFYADSVKVAPEIELDRSLWQKVVLPTDGELACYGGSIENLWDGNAATWYHSACSGESGNIGDDIPHHFTLDLGVHTVLSKFLITPRDKKNERNPKHFQVWGRSDLDGAETTAVANDPAWEDDALSKGWVLLHDETCDDSWNGSSNDYELKILSDTPIRYMRLRILETFDGGSATALSEFKFWGSIE